MGRWIVALLVALVGFLLMAVLALGALVCAGYRYHKEGQIQTEEGKRMLQVRRDFQRKALAQTRHERDRHGVPGNGLLAWSAARIPVGRTLAGIGRALAPSRQSVRLDSIRLQTELAATPAGAVRRGTVALRGLAFGSSADEEVNALVERLSASEMFESVRVLRYEAAPAAVNRGGRLFEIGCGFKSVGMALSSREEAEAGMRSIRRTSREILVQRQRSAEALDLLGGLDRHVLRPVLGNYLAPANAQVEAAVRSVGLVPESLREIGMADVPGTAAPTAAWRTFVAHARLSASHEEVERLVSVLEDGNPCLWIWTLAIERAADSAHRPAAVMSLRWPVWADSAAPPVSAGLDAVPVEPSGVAAAKESVGLPAGFPAPAGAGGSRVSAADGRAGSVAWPKLKVTSISHSGDRYFALVEGVGVVGKGDICAVTRRGVTFRWRVADISHEGAFITPLEAVPAR
jgi:hypothetical protein